MDKFQLNLGCALLFALLLVACRSHAGSISPEEVSSEYQEGPPISRFERADERELVVVELNGRRYTAPVNENVKITDVRRKFDTESITKIVKKFRELIRLIMVEKRCHLRVAKSAMGILPIFVGVSKDLRKMQKTDTSPRFEQGYAQKMGTLVVDLVAHKSDEKLDDKEVQKRTDDFVTAVERIVSNSPTGLYLDWTEFKVDGQSLISYTSPILRWCRDNGYSMELKLFDGLASILKSYNNKGN